jgi:hypothetical protein
MVVVLKYVISCESLGLEESFQGIWFGHAFSKACQYGTTKGLQKFEIWNAPFSLRNLEKVNMNGTRLVWKLEFNPENWIS